MRKAITALALCCAASASATQHDWENHNIIQINREPARSHFMPFATETGDRHLSLNGTWQFRWAPTPETINKATWTTLQVPSTWEVNGFGTPIYSSSGYTFRINPPYVMDTPKKGWTSEIERNPTGQYRRTFSLPASWQQKGGQTYVRFDGVMSAFYVFINGKQAGYSQGSHHPSEFNITPFLKAGENEISLQVYKYSDGSYIEDQDAWRYAGVHRDVTLFHTPDIRLRDFAVRTIATDKTYETFALQINPFLQSHSGADGEGYVVRAELFDAENMKVSTMQTDAKAVLNLAHKAGIMNEWLPQRGHMKFNRMDDTIRSVKPWTAETPYLYTLRLALLDNNGNIIEQAEQKVGFRQLEIHNGMFLVNGKQVRFRGVNRVEHDPYTARTISEERMLQDIKLMKQANINAVRTAHSPAHPRWYELCDSLGLYVLDEADCENHGVRGEFTSTPSWNTAMMDRVIRLAERDKNHPCVVFWSLGNESGYGANHSAMAGWLHEFDPTRFVHYEGAQGTTEGNISSTDVPQPDPLCVDVISRFYPRVMQEYLNPGVPEGSDKERAENARWEHLLAIAQREWKFTGGYLDGVVDTRPVLTSEYAHCMGNALGNFQDYWNEIYSNRRMLGGFIWDWADQGIIRDGWIHYGGDFGDKPNLKAFCFNGVVMSDRGTSPKFYEVKHVYAPVQFSKHGNEIYVINRHHHTSLAPYTLAATLSVNGKQQKPFIVDTPDLAPGDSTILKQLTDCIANVKHKGDVRLNITATRQGETEPVVEEQFSIAGSVMDYTSVIKQRGKLPQSLTETPIASLKATFFRAPTDNDKSFGNWVAKDWTKHNMANPVITVVSEENVDENTVKKVEKYAFAQGAILVTTTTTRLSNGTLDIVQEYECQGDLPELARMGMQITLPKDYEQIEYYGRGPGDTYPDRWQSCHVGLWKSTVTDEYIHFPRPQDCGNHQDCASVVLKNSKGRTFRVTAVEKPFSFSALHFTPQDIANTTHDHRLPDNDYTILSVDCAVLGIGNSSCGPGVLKKYSIDKTKKHRLHVNVQMR